MADLPPLVCPACRPAKLSQRFACRLCQAVYPVVDGVPLILRNPQAALDNQAADPGMFERYVASQFPDRAASPRLTRRLMPNLRLRNWIEQCLGKREVSPGPALELGCGPGALAGIWAGVCSSTTLCDLRPDFVLSAARHMRDTLPQHPSRALVCDAHDPPFLAESMSLVAAINLLDITPEPWLLLGQLDALLKPGGVLVVAMPFTSNFDSPASLRAALQGRAPHLQYLRYQVLAARDWFPWIVPASERLVHEYQVHALIARKPPGDTMP